MNAEQLRLFLRRPNILDLNKQKIKTSSKKPETKREPGRRGRVIARNRGNNAFFSNTSHLSKINDLAIDLQKVKSSLSSLEKEFSIRNELKNFVNKEDYGADKKAYSELIVSKFQSLPYYERNYVRPKETPIFSDLIEHKEKPLEITHIEEVEDSSTQTLPQLLIEHNPSEEAQQPKEEFSTPKNVMPELSSKTTIPKDSTSIFLEKIKDKNSVIHVSSEQPKHREIQESNIPPPVSQDMMRNQVMNKQMMNTETLGGSLPYSQPIIEELKEEYKNETNPEDDWGELESEEDEVVEDQKPDEVIITDETKKEKSRSYAPPNNERERIDYSNPYDYKYSYFTKLADENNVSKRGLDREGLVRELLNKKIIPRYK